MCPILPKFNSYIELGFSRANEYMNVFLSGIFDKLQGKLFTAFLVKNELITSEKNLGNDRKVNIDASGKPSTRFPPEGLVELPGHHRT